MFSISIFLWSNYCVQFIFLLTWLRNVVGESDSTVNSSVSVLLEMLSPASPTRTELIQFRLTIPIFHFSTLSVYCNFVIDAGSQFYSSQTILRLKAQLAYNLGIGLVICCIVNCCVVRNSEGFLTGLLNHINWDINILPYQW